jgi:hypothetical protein
MRGLKGDVVERFGWFWLVEVFGILRCAQDDSRNKTAETRQRQEQAETDDCRNKSDSSEIE